MATYEVSTRSLGCLDVFTEETNYFLSGQSGIGWIIFPAAGIATPNNVFQGADPLAVALSEVSEYGFSAAGIIVDDNGDLPLNIEPTEVALKIFGIGSIFKSTEEGDFVRVVTGLNIPDYKAAPATEFRIHSNTDLPQGIIADTLPILVLDANTRSERWTRDNIFLERFGVYSQVTSGVGGNDVAICQMSVRVTFLQVPPTVATAPSGRSGGSSLLTFGGSVNPLGATSAFL